MPYHKTHLVTEKDKHRLHKSLVNLLILTDGIFFSIRAHTGSSKPYRPGASAGMLSKVTNLQISIPLYGPVLSALKEEEPERIQMEVGDWVQTLIENVGRGFGKVLFVAISPIFVEFFERHRPWMETTLGNRKNWPPILNFCSAVRNAISHDGKVYFLNQNPAPAIWYNLKYTYADNGRLAIGGDLEFGDILLLMFEASDELDRLGCPISL